MNIKSTIFREYDIRGRVDLGELSPQIMVLLGRGVAAFLARQGVTEVVVGYDSRSYSSGLAKEFSRGLIMSGCKVVNIGQVLSPIAYFAQHHLKIKGLAMITASHNPNGWCGLKLGADLSVTLTSDEIQTIRKIIEDQAFIEGDGQLEEDFSVVAAYQSELVSKIKVAKPYKIVVDCGNGTAGPIVPQILREAGCQVIEQYCQLDDTFPHHEPNPTAKVAQQALKEGVLDHQADFGFGFDGDGDRLGVVDHQGNPVWSDRILALLARQALSIQPGGAIVFDVKCSQALVEDIEAHGGQPLMWKTGHSWIKQKMKQSQAVLAGERSGHFFFKQDHYGYDDAAWAALRLLQYLADFQLKNPTLKTLAQVIKTIPEYLTSPAYEVFCADELKYQLVDKIKADLITEFGEERVNQINGARVSFPDGWGLVRASSNEPKIVLVFEAKTEAALAQIKNVFQEKLAKHPDIGAVWQE